MDSSRQVKHPQAFNRLRAQLRANMGAQRTSVLVEQGVPRVSIEHALRTGLVMRPSRGWVALPNTDEQLLSAARHHVVLSCVTQARRLGLWVKDPPEQMHVAAPYRGAKVRATEFRVHWRVPLIPRPPFTLQDPIEDVLHQVAYCLPREDAIVIWESALNKRMTDALYLANLPLGRRARQLLSDCTPFSDSGLETLVCSRLRWLRIPLRQQIYIEGHRVDVLIGKRLVVQLDGAHHTGRQRDLDMAHDATLMRRGYNVLRFSYAQVMHHWEEVQGAILEAIAQGAHSLSPAMW